MREWLGMVPSLSLSLPLSPSLSLSLSLCARVTFSRVMLGMRDGPLLYWSIWGL
jgi:hypothetical protein